MLDAIRDGRQRKEQADRELRLLIAYARELVTPCPRRLADVAEAAGMSISGVRVAYTTADVDCITTLLAAHNGPEREHGSTAV